MVYGPNFVPIRVGFLGLGKKERAHAEFVRTHERESMEQEQELKDLEYRIRKAKLLKQAAEAGVEPSTSTPDPSTPTPESSGLYWGVLGPGFIPLRRG